MCVCVCCNFQCRIVADHTGKRVCSVGSLWFHYPRHLISKNHLPPIYRPLRRIISRRQSTPRQITVDTGCVTFFLVGVTYNRRPYLLSGSVMFMRISRAYSNPLRVYLRRTCCTVFVLHTCGLFCYFADVHNPCHDQWLEIESVHKESLIMHDWYFLLISMHGAEARRLTRNCNGNNQSQSTSSFQPTVIQPIKALSFNKPNSKKWKPITIWHCILVHSATWV